MKRTLSIILAILILATAAAPALAEGVKIGWYAPGTNQYTETVHIGVEAFMADYPDADVKVIFGDTEQTNMDNNVRALVADGYNNISTFPCTEGAAGLYSDIASFGVRVAGWGASTSAQTELLAVASDVEAAAYTATEEAIKGMGGSGGILNVLEVLGDTNTLKRRDGVNACIEAYADQGVTLVQEVGDINNIEEGVTKISAALSANEGEIDAIVCTGTQTSSAATQVLYDYYARNPEADKIVLVCLDTADDVMKGIEDGIVYGTIAQNTFAHGYVPCAALYLMETEGLVPAEDTFLIDSRCVLVTQDNIDTYEDELTEVTQQIVADLSGTYLVAP